MQVTLDTHSEKEGKKTNQGTAEAVPTVSVYAAMQAVLGFWSSPVAPRPLSLCVVWAVADRKLALEEKVPIQRSAVLY